MSIDLTCEQRRAARAEGNSWVVACPGSGKTRVALARTLREASLVEKGGSSVLALSFSVSAKEELARRIAQHAGIRARKNISVATIHAFCIGEILIPFGSIVMGRNVDLALPGSRAYSDALQFCASEVGLSPDEIGRSLDYVRRAPDGRSFRGSIACNADLHARAVTFWDSLLAAGYVDYPNALYIALSILREKKWIRDGISTLYPSIVVDEFQDCTDIQVAIIEELVNSGSNVTLVGDLHQCVFGFAGADVQVLGDFADRIGARRLSLTGTQRCPKAVVDVAERVFERGMHPVGEAALVHGEVIYDHAFSPVRVIEQLVNMADSAGIRRSDVAFVCTMNARIDQIVTGLASRGIEALPGNSRSNVEDWYAELIESYLLADRPLEEPDIASLARAMEGLVVRFAAQKLNLFAARAFSNAVAEEVLSGPILPDDKIANLISVINSRVIQILHRSRLIRRSDIAAIDEALASASKLFARRVFAGLTRSEGLHRLRPGEQVRGYTYQGVKGLQFEAVAVVDIADRLLPHRDRLDLWDDARKLYVGLTRAKRLLGIHAPSQASQKSMFYSIVMGLDTTVNVIGEPMPDSLRDES